MSNEPRFTLRRATAEDAARLAHVGRRLFAQTFGPANTPEDMQLYLAGAFSEEKQRAELNDENRVVWLAENGGEEAVGYASLLRGSHSDGISAHCPAEIERIYADAALHGAGLGSALMRACAEQATAWGCDVLWLAVWERNPRAIAFYTKTGFHAAGAKTFLLGTDPQRDIVMARNL